MQVLPQQALSTSSSKRP